MKILYLNRTHLKQTLSIRLLEAIQIEDFVDTKSIYTADRVIFTDTDGKTRVLKDKEVSKLDEANILLRNARTELGELIDKAWEVGGYSVGENEFNSYSWVLDARETIAEIDKYLNNK